MSITSRGGLLPALLKHWRRHRGLSQLDLALAADVSSRHISFLETGRSKPSAEMILRLAATLDVPLRQTNALLQAGGFEAMYAEEADPTDLPPEVAQALTLLKTHHEPFPVVVINRAYDVLDLNQGAMALFGAAVPHLTLGDEPLNLGRFAFDPRGARDAIVNFDEVGRAFLWRLQREVLAHPDDARLRTLLDDLLALPTVAPDWRDVDLSAPSLPAIAVHLRAGPHVLRFVTMVTAFQAPQSVLLDELRIETWLPIDPETAAACRALTTG